jgi:hypothetical protein
MAAFTWDRQQKGDALCDNKFGPKDDYPVSSLRACSLKTRNNAQTDERRKGFKLNESARLPQKTRPI